MTRSVGLALAFAALVTGCSHRGGADKASTGPLQVISGSMSGFGLNGRRIAWEGAGRVVVADLDSGRRVRVAEAEGSFPVAMALSGSSVVWFDVTGGLAREDTLFTASPRSHRKTLANWYEETSASVPIGPLFGGVAGQGGTLAFALYKLSPPGGNANACYEKPCRRRVAGGGVFRITPGTLTVRRVLPPAQAIAATNQAIAAAVLRQGSLYTGNAQVVVKDLSNGTRRSIGQPASVLAVGLDRSHVAALIGPENGWPRLLRVWNVGTGRLVRNVRVPGVERVVILAGSHAVLRLGRTIFTLNLRTGRKHMLSEGYGPWVSDGRVLWIETYDQGRPKARFVIRSAPLPGAAG
jgi:hypothetical protein